MWLYVSSFRLFVGGGYQSGRDECKSTLQFSNLKKYGHGPPEDGFKGDRNMWGRILSV
jgi:hypothetical protein